MSDADGKIWEEVRAELERRYPGLEVPIREPSGLEWGRQQAIGAGPRAPTGAPIVRTFWWGFHVEISSQSLRDFLSVADPASALVAAIGPATGPAAPFVLAIASFVRLALQTLRGLDRGNGVYVSMSWFAPGVFIPTSVPAGRHTAFRRLPGEPYEQAGDPWHRSYGGGLFGLRLEEDIYWNLPDGTERVEPIVHLNPLNFGNIYVRNWLSNDPTVGHFRLHVGVAAFAGGRVEVRMMIRDVESRRSSALVSGPRAVTREDLEPSRDPLIDEATVGGNGRPTARHVESLVE